MPNTIEAVYKYVINAMTARGFTTQLKTPGRRSLSRSQKTVRPHAVMGQHPQYAGLRFAFTTYTQDNRLDFVVKRKSKGSGYTNLLSIQLKLFDKLINCRDNQHSIEVADAELQKVIAAYDEHVVPILENGYPEPYLFAEHCNIYRSESINHTNSNRSFVRFVNSTQLREVEILSIVTINHGHGTVNVHADSIQTPGTDCFFLIEVISHSYATGNIITDGTKFWPVSRISRSDLASPRRNRRQVIKLERSFDKASLSTSLSSLDQKLVNAAIIDWCRGISGNI